MSRGSQRGWARPRTRGPRESRPVTAGRPPRAERAHPAPGTSFPLPCLRQSDHKHADNYEEYMSNKRTSCFRTWYVNDDLKGTFLRSGRVTHTKTLQRFSQINI